MNESLKIWAITAIYITFLSLIGFAVWYLHSGWPLWGMAFMPEVKWRKGKEE